MADNTNKTTSVYVLEDDPDIRDIYQRELSTCGFTVTTFRTIEDFAVALELRHCDLCIADLNLPDGDALSIIRTTIADKAIPTIIVSARGSLGDRVLGLDLGADDYLVKPVDMIELTARARSLLRRVKVVAENQTDQTMIYSFDQWRVNFASYQLTHSNGYSERMSMSDAELLRAFLNSPGQVLSRDKLLVNLKPETDELYDRSIDVRISRLRKKLNQAKDSPEYIKTVYGAGYLFTASVTS